MKIPRCRATVSEEIATGHWGNPGRPLVVIGRRKASSLAKPGDRREPSTLTPFACQRRSACGFFVVSLLSQSWSRPLPPPNSKSKWSILSPPRWRALKLKFIAGRAPTPAAVQTTSAEGLAEFRGFDGLGLSPARPRGRLRHRDGGYSRVRRSSHGETSSGSGHGNRHSQRNS